MKKAKLIINLITKAAVVAFFVSLTMLESASVLPIITLALSLGWLWLYGWAQVYQPRKGGVKRVK